MPSEKEKGILYGLPVLLTDGGGCEAANPIAGVYEGSYWAGLWEWLTRDWGDDTWLRNAQRRKTRLRSCVTSAAGIVKRGASRD